METSAMSPIFYLALNGILGMFTTGPNQKKYKAINDTVF